MFTKYQIDYLAAWCRDLSFGNYAGADHKTLRTYVAVDLANALDNVHEGFDHNSFLAECGITHKDLR